LKHPRTQSLPGKFPNHRLVSFAEGQVTFRWRDSAHNNEQKLLTLSLDEFLRRFLLHLLPKGFVRIRNFGFLANRRRATLLPLCFHWLGAVPQTQQPLATANDANDLRLCPECGGPMKVIERLTAAEIQLRSPPWSAHGCRMKQLTTTPDLCVPQHAQSLCALPFFQPRLSTSASHFFARILHLRYSLLSQCRLLCSLARPGAAGHRIFPQLNLHRARIRRNRGRLPSNGFIERAPEQRAHSHFFPERAPPISTWTITALISLASVTKTRCGSASRK
jgi:Putative transposase